MLKYYYIFRHKKTPANLTDVFLRRVLRIRSIIYRLSTIPYYHE
nr:MAG TPA: hypothetical protein [Caudoviricetes sp.]